MAVLINGTSLKKCNVNGGTCKKIIVNGENVWRAEYSLVPNTEGVLATDTSDGGGKWSSNYDDPKWQSDGTLWVYFASGGQSTTVHKTPIDVTSYSKITFIVSSVSGEGEFYMQLGTTTSFSWDEPYDGGTTTGPYDIDLSNINGNRYLIFRGKSNPGVVFSQIYLEE